MENNEQLIEKYKSHIKFLLTFSDYVMPEKPVKDGMYTDYLTGNYEAELGLWELLEVVKTDIK